MKTAPFHPHPTLSARNGGQSGGRGSDSDAVRPTARDRPSYAVERPNERVRILVIGALHHHVRCSRPRRGERTADTVGCRSDEGSLSPDSQPSMYRSADPPPRLESRDDDPRSASARSTGYPIGRLPTGGSPRRRARGRRNFRGEIPSGRLDVTPSPRRPTSSRTTRSTDTTSSGVSLAYRDHLRRLLRTWWCPPASGSPGFSRAGRSTKRTDRSTPLCP